MDWGAHLDTALVCAVLAAVAGWFGPLVVARLPEPEPDPEVNVEADPKPLYVDLAAAPRIAWWTAGWSAVAAALVGLEVGWAWPLLFLLPLVPIGVTLAWVDHRTRLLPRRIVIPTYPLTIVLIVAAALLEGDTGNLIRAGLGWLTAGFLFWFLWRFTPGMGYGDVRLSGILGMALGYLGWGELLLGTYAGFLVGVVGWIPLRLLGHTNDRSFPFGPFMLVGALIGVLWGDDMGRYLGG